MRLNTVRNQPNFGMAIHSNATVNQILKSRIRNQKDLNLLNEIIESQVKNKRVDITLFANPDSKTISANVYNAAKNDVDGYFFRQASENTFTRLFDGPFGFLKRVARIADKQEEKLAKKDLNYSDVFKKIN